jgi:toxin CptA
MSKSRRSSIASAPCRIEWRPSRWPGAMLWSLAVLAPLSLLASDLPRAWAWPLALLACAWAIFDARRYRAMPPRQLTIPDGRRAATCDGERIDALQVGWRGPLAFLRWRDAQGRRQRASCWPDTLPAGMRRELRIMMHKRDAASDPASMAG